MTERQPPRLEIPTQRPDLPSIYQDDRRGQGTRQAAHGRAPGQSRRPVHRRRSSPVLAALFYVTLTLVALLVTAATFLFIAAPTDLIRDQLIAEVKARTGRDLTISGPTSLTFFPALGVSMADVSLSPPPGMAGGPTLTAGSLDVSVQAMPLLSRQIQIQRLVIRRPVVDLRVDIRGQKSWQFGAVDPSTLRGHPVRLAQAPRPANDGGAVPSELDAFIKGSTQPKRADPRQTRAGDTAPVGWGGIDSLTLDDVRIENGTLRYADERTGMLEEIRSVSVRLGLKSLEAPLFVSGQATIRGEPMTLDGRINSPAQIMAGAPAKVLLKAGSKIVEASIDGGLTLGSATFAWDGIIALDAPSIAALARFGGRSLPDAPGTGRVKLAGQVKATDSVVTLTNSQIALDGTEITGNATVRLTGARPTLIADLQTSELNIDRLTALAAAIANAPPLPRSQAPGMPIPAPQPGLPAKSITDLIEATEPDQAPPRGPAAKVRGYTARDGWSEQAFDISALTLLDVDAKLAIAGMVRQQLKIGRTTGTVQLRSGQLRVAVDQMQLYDGQVRGLLTLSGQGADAALGLNLTADGIAAQNLLKDTAGFDGIAGKGKLTLVLSARGGSERALVETSTGKADIAFADGAIIGYNFPQMIRSLGQGNFGGLDRTPSEKTDFSELAATFTITSGVARTQDLRLASPLLRVAGTGQVNLVGRSLDLSLKPKLVGTLAGQGGAAALQGVELPLKLTGPWDRPKVTPDLDVLRDPAKAAEAAKEIGRQLSGKSPEEIIKGLTGGSGEVSDKTKAKAKQLLDQFLKR